MPSSPPPSRGLFIVFEGLDRSGKSTQVDRLVRALDESGRRARLQRFPDRTTAIGQMIDSYLRSHSDLDDRAVHLLFSANRWETVVQIERDLQSGISVIADRYAFSGIAFSAAKGLPFDFCLNSDAGLPLPDVTFYLTVPVHVAAQRDEYGSERYETIEIQQKVREQFELVGAEVTKRHGDEKWEVIEAGGSIEKIAQEVWMRVQQSAGNATLERLWI